MCMHRRTGGRGGHGGHSLCHWANVPMTDDADEVTCTKCLEQMAEQVELALDPPDHSGTVLGSNAVATGSSGTAFGSNAVATNMPSFFEEDPE